MKWIKIFKRDYIPLSHRPGEMDGLLFSVSYGEMLDRYAKLNDMYRRRFEPDFLFKTRMRNKFIRHRKEYYPL